MSYCRWREREGERGGGEKGERGGGGRGEGGGEREGSKGIIRAQTKAALRVKGEKKQKGRNFEEDLVTYGIGI